MDISFVLCPNLLGILGLSILLMFSRFNFYLDDRKLKLFQIAAAINLAIIVFEVMDYLLGGTPFPSAYLLRRVTSATGFALSPIFPLLLAQISSKSELPRWSYIPAFINILLSYSSIFTGNMFLIDEWNSYYRGPLFIVMLVSSLFYLAVLIYISFKDLRSVRVSESGFLICIVAVIIVGNFLEMALFFHFIFWNSCAVLLICYYLYLHIQYFKYDQLTKAFNRSMFTAELDNMSNKDNVGVISFDLDNLKQINDQEGHERGDEYIVAAAKQIDQSFSDVGRLYRVGGDEFVVLMSNTTRKVIENKIEIFRNLCIENDISISCGYAFEVSASNLPEMLRSADKAMYANKRERRANR